MSRRQRSRPRSSGAAAPVAQVDVQLQMECEEEELSPWQQAAFASAKQKFLEAMQKIKEAREYRIVQAAMTRSTVQQTQQRSGPAAKTKGSDSPDVIILDDDEEETVSVRQTRGKVTRGSDKALAISPQQRPSQQMLLQQQMLQQQLIAAQLAKQANQFLSAASLAGNKRGVEGNMEDGPARKRALSSKNLITEKPETSWVPLDEYYYGKKEGDPVYREEKGEFRFKCWYCHKMLYNNLRIMQHMQGHIDNEKQQNLDLSDLTQCKHCYKQFDTPFEMQCHIEKVHQNKSNVLVCRICEKDHESQTALRQHMRNYHLSCEMPYVCQLCYFRSSVYSDVVDHFKKRHDSSEYILCLYCLRIFKVNFSKNGGWGLTQNYYQHLQKHQLKNSTKKCAHCKLTFVHRQDAKMHKSKDHQANYRGINNASSGTTTTNPEQEQVMIRLQEMDSSKTTKSLKSLNAPAVAKVRELRGLAMPAAVRGNRCCECGKNMMKVDHYRKHVECTMCRYATACAESYANHMLGFHSGRKEQNSVIPREHAMPHNMHCLCGFMSKYGNALANHLVVCSKRTCYSMKPETKFFEYDDEQEEFNPFEPYVEEPDVPDSPAKRNEGKEQTLFDALGLVKKTSNSRTGSIKSDPSSRASPIILPDEMPGDKKWVDKSPSKNSIMSALNKSKTEKKNLFSSPEKQSPQKAGAAESCSEVKATDVSAASESSPGASTAEGGRTDDGTASSGEAAQADEAKDTSAATDACNVEEKASSDAAPDDPLKQDPEAESALEAALMKSRSDADTTEDVPEVLPNESESDNDKEKGPENEDRVSLSSPSKTSDDTVQERTSDDVTGDTVSVKSPDVARQDRDSSAETTMGDDSQKVDEMAGSEPEEDTAGSEPEAETRNTHSREDHDGPHEESPHVEEETAGSEPEDGMAGSEPESESVGHELDTDTNAAPSAEHGSPDWEPPSSDVDLSGLETEADMAGLQPEAEGAVMYPSTESSNQLEQEAYLMMQQPESEAAQLQPAESFDQEVPVEAPSQQPSDAQPDPEVKCCQPEPEADSSPEQELESFLQEPEAEAAQFEADASLSQDQAPSEMVEAECSQMDSGEAAGAGSPTKFSMETEATQAYIEENDAVESAGMDMEASESSAVEMMEPTQSSVVEAVESDSLEVDDQSARVESDEAEAWQRVDDQDLPSSSLPEANTSPLPNENLDEDQEVNLAPQAEQALLAAAEEDRQWSESQEALVAGEQGADTAESEAAEAHIEAAGTEVEAMNAEVAPEGTTSPAKLLPTEAVETQLEAEQQPDSDLDHPGLEPTEDDTSHHNEEPSVPEPTDQTQGSVEPHGMSSQITTRDCQQEIEKTNFISSLSSTENPGTGLPQSSSFEPSSLPSKPASQSSSEQSLKSSSRSPGASTPSHNRPSHRSPAADWSSPSSRSSQKYSHSSSSSSSSRSERDRHRDGYKKSEHRDRDRSSHRDSQYRHGSRDDNRGYHDNRDYYRGGQHRDRSGNQGQYRDDRHRDRRDNRGHDNYNRSQHGNNHNRRGNYQGRGGYYGNRDYY